MSTKIIQMMTAMDVITVAALLILFAKRRYSLWGSGQPGDEVWLA